MTTAATSFAPAQEPARTKDLGSATAVLTFVACIVALFILRYSFMRANGFAFDEPVHIQAGYRYWQCGEFANNPEHPPFVKFLASAPIRHWQIDAFPSACGTKVIPSRSDVEAAIAVSIFRSPNASQILWKARSILVFFPLLLLVSLFVAVRAWFGNLAAAVAALLVTIEPTLVAHGSFVTTDMAVTATLFLTIVLGIAYVSRPSSWLAGSCGVALGMTLASKQVQLVLFANRHHWLREAYSAGLADVMERSERPTYFFGRFYEKGFWYYFPAALAIKLTLGVLLLALVALLIPSTWRKQRANLIPFIFPPFAYSSTG